MVRTWVLRNLRMRKQNANKAVPLDALPERRTERCSLRFRPGGRFWGELRFRYLSPGGEGDKYRPLDHRWQIPFVHSARFISSSKFYIYRAISSVWYILLWLCILHIWQWRMHYWRVTYFKIQSHYLIHFVFHLVLAGAYWHKIDVHLRMRICWTR